MMAQRKPDLAVGDTIERVETPALILDLDVFDANLAAMAEFARVHNMRLRPHGKTHKCATIGKRQMVSFHVNSG